MEKLKSRKFILALATGILIVLNDGLNLGLNTETIMYVVGIVATWITGEALVDTARAKKTAAAKAPNNEETYH